MKRVVCSWTSVRKCELIVSVERCLERDNKLLLSYERMCAISFKSAEEIRTEER